MKLTTFLLAVGAVTGSVMASGIQGSGIIVLDGSGSGALELAGASRVHVPAKAVYVNSNHNSAVTTSGTAKLDVPFLFVVGNAKFTGTSLCTGDVVRTGTPCSDPMSNVQCPSPEGMQARPQLNITGGNHSIEPGFYSNGISISGNANVTLQPGVYLVSNGFNLTSGSVAGYGVCIVMLSGAFDVAGSSGFALTPPTNNAMSGIVFYQPWTNTTQMKLAGGSEVLVSGAMYAPKATMWITGTADVEGQGPTVGDLLVSHRLRLTGTGSIKIGNGNMQAIVPPKLPLAD
jgi:hypothetical protein